MMQKDLLGNSSERFMTFLSALLPAVFLSVLYIFFIPYFESNDDIFMNLISAGKVLSVQPSPYLLYQKQPIGYLLSALYEAVSNISWYALLQYAMLYFSLSVLTFVLMFKTRSWLAVICLYFVFTVFFAGSLVALQFTKTAIITGFSSIVGLLYLFEKSKHLGVKTYYFLTTILSIMLALSFCMRTTGFVLSVAISGVYIVFIIYKMLKNEGLKVLNMRLLGSVIILVVVFLGAVYSEKSTDTPEYAKWHRLNDSLQYFIDHPAIGQKFTTKAGMSNNDLAMIKKWIFFDDVVDEDQVDLLLELGSQPQHSIFSTFIVKVTSLKKIKKILSKNIAWENAGDTQTDIQETRAPLASEAATKLSKPMINTRKSSSGIRQPATRPQYILTLVLFVIVCSIFFFSSKSAKYFLLLSILSIGCCLWIFFNVRYTNRVVEPILAFTAILPLLFCRKNDKSKSFGTLHIVKVALLLLCLFGGVVFSKQLPYLQEMSKEYSGIHEQNVKMITDLCEIDSKPLFIASPEDILFINQLVLPLSSIDYLDNFTYLGGSSYIKAPTSIAQLMENKMSSVLMGAINKKNCYFLLPESASTGYLFKNYFNERGVFVDFEVKGSIVTPNLVKINICQLKSTK